MDKSWIDLRDRTSKEYIEGVERFLIFAYRDKDVNKNTIYCPCKVCVNRYYHNIETVKAHIEMKGFSRDYKCWFFHGEPLGGHSNSLNDNILVNETLDEPNTGANMAAMVMDGMRIPFMGNNMDNDEEPMFEDVVHSAGEEAKFYKRLKESEGELYENCPKDVTELSFIVGLLNLKQLGRWTNNSFTMLLEFLKKTFPRAKIPKSYYHASKLTSDLGFKYDSWDACPNGCMLFRKEAESLEKCDICGASRYREDDINDDGAQQMKVAIRRVRYFPLKPRLQRLFWSSHTASLMRWHAEKRCDDGVQRHPADSIAWKKFDERNPSFAVDCRNVRIGLATDGFNPFGNMSISHSTWPVMVIPYNLPPSYCTKQSNIILCLLIDGPKDPGNKLDVFLQPLIEELADLWNDGANTYDASSKRMFRMRVALIWTVNDFPAFAMISGWSTKGKFACPYCNMDPQSIRLDKCRKWCYWGHRRFLPPRHRWRREKEAFNGKQIMHPPPRKLSGVQVLQQLNDLGIESEYIKEDVLRKRKREELEKTRAKQTKSPLEKTHNWKQRSILFDLLPYWPDNPCRHLLDVMHVEKNFCDNVLFTLLGSKRSKDHLNSRKDLQSMKIREGLHPQPRGRNMQYIAPAEFTMSKDEKDIFLKVLRDMKVPDGYSSNISRCVNLGDRTISGLKSHDNHILMQQLLPIALRRVLPKHVVRVLIELSNCFGVLCSRNNHIADLEKFEDRMAILLCSLERIFPPSFFDVMEHLPIHLADELRVAGCVAYRWMYPIERYLGFLKQHMRNRAHPEASIAKSVLHEECMNFCAKYLDENIETKFNHPARIYDGVNHEGWSKSKKVPFKLDFTSWTQVHRCVLGNTTSVKPFIDKHIDELSQKYPHANQRGLVQRMHSEQFDIWFKEYVSNGSPDVPLTSQIKSLASGPLFDASRLKSYNIHGLKFRTKSVDTRRSTQNSGVMLKVRQTCVASGKDQNPVPGDLTYYGQLIDIIEIQYLNGISFVLFRCDWVDNRFGLKVDEYKFKLVNFTKLLYKGDLPTDEPFILAAHAEQIWYSQDPLEPDWHVVVSMTPRSNFDKYSIDEDDQDIPQIQPFSIQDLDQVCNTSWVRTEIDGAVVDTNIIHQDIQDDMDDE